MDCKHEFYTRTADPAPTCRCGSKQVIRHPAKEPQIIRMSHDNYHSNCQNCGHQIQDGEYAVVLEWMDEGIDGAYCEDCIRRACAKLDALKKATKISGTLLSARFGGTPAGLKLDIKLENGSEVDHTIFMEIHKFIKDAGVEYVHQLGGEKVECLLDGDGVVRRCAVVKQHGKE